ELFNTTLAGNKMENYLNQVKRLYDELMAKDVIIPEKVIFAWVLNNLTPQYETLITTITQSIRVNGSKSISLSELFANLIDESKRVKYRDSENDKTALFTSAKNRYKDYQKGNKVEKPKRQKETCSYCKRGVHHIDKCWFKHPELRPSTKPKKDSSPEESEVEKDAEMAMMVHSSNSFDILDTADENENSFVYLSSKNDPSPNRNQS
ncbi:MAG: hypothetical protein M1812_008598, partial [Candelaria pacifica]